MSNKTKNKAGTGEARPFEALVRRMENVISVAKSIDKKQRDGVVIWAMRHINNIVWVVSTDKMLELDVKYKATPGSEFPTKYFRVHDRWKPDSLYRYLVTEILNEEYA